MSRIHASGKSLDITAVLDAPVPVFDLRSAWDNLRVFTAFADGDGDDDGDGDGDKSGDGKGDGDDADKGTSGSAGDDIKDPEKQRLSQEAAANRVKAREAVAERDALAARLQAIEDKDKDATDVLTRKVEEATATIAGQADTIKSQAVRLAFFESGSAAQFRDPAVALRLLRDDLKDVEVNDDGEADSKAIKDAAEALLKASPYLKAGDGDDDGGDGDDDEVVNPSGRQTNGKKKSKDDLDREALAKKFPALRR